MVFTGQDHQDKALINRREKLKVLHHSLFSIRLKENYLKLLYKRYKWKSPLPNVKTVYLIAVINDFQSHCNVINSGKKVEIFAKDTSIKPVVYANIAYI